MRSFPAPAAIAGLAASLFLVSCSASLPGTASPAAVGFVNQTHHSEQDLWTIWKSAQQNLSRQVDLNPLQRSLYSTQPDLQPGDPRALNVQPRQLRVAAQSDVPSADLLARTGLSRPDPTGLIACPRPCNVQYAAAYSFQQPELTKYASSWENQDDNFFTILQYEFENQILAEL